MAGAAIFAALAILNSGGYRYGASDQAFYIPAILEHQDPNLFPRDRALIDPQSRLMLLDEAAAWLSTRAGIRLPALFLGAHLMGLALLFGGIAALGRHFFKSWWTVAALTLALTLRHRIAKAGVNTLEGYLHPRMLAFAIGVWAVVCLLRRRPAASIALVALAALFHPTTAVWFAVMIGVALMVDATPRMRGLAAAGAVFLALGAWMMRPELARDALTVMDAPWIAAFSHKDYVFPSGWPTSVWLLIGSSVVVLLACYSLRRRRGMLVNGEPALFAGALALTGLFVLSLPLVAWHLALFVQLQIPRVLWLIDLLLTIYVVWLLCEAPGTFRWAPASRQRALVAVLAVLSLSRGLYITFVEHAERPALQVELPGGDWQDVMNWAARTPSNTHLLVSPGHAWRYGTSVRVAAARDVYLEEVKDSAMALYSRDVARRVVQRIQDLGDFNQLTVDHALALSAKYDLDYLVTTRSLDLPVAYRNARFTAYSLRPRGSPPAS